MVRLRASRNALGEVPGVQDSSLVGRWALSHFGPLGSYGPLSNMGPFSAGRSNSGSGYEGAALGPAGPLGNAGPLSSVSLRTLLKINQATWSLFPGHLLGLLGPGGMLGPLGLTGPLGPHGAHGLATSPDGSYVDTNGQVVRESHGLELFEFHGEPEADAIQDTSFAIAGQLSTMQEVDRFRLRSKCEQWVSVLVVPEKAHPSSQIFGALWWRSICLGREALSGESLDRWNSRAESWFDRFRLELTTVEGEPIAQCESREGPGWVQVRVPEGGELEIALACNSSWHDDAKAYRLLVCGAGKAFEKVERGPDQGQVG